MVQSHAQHLRPRSAHTGPARWLLGWCGRLRGGRGGRDVGLRQRRRLCSVSCTMSLATLTCCAFATVPPSSPADNSTWYLCQVGESVWYPPRAPLVPVVSSHWRFQPITRSLVVITPRAGLCPAVTDRSAPLAPLRPCIIHLIARSRCTYPAPTAFRPAQLPRCLTSFPTCSIFQATSAGMHRALNHCSSLQSRPLLTTVDHIEGIARHQQSPLSPGPKLCQNLGQPSLSRKQPPRAANITSSR